MRARRSPTEHGHFEAIEKFGVTIYYTAPTLIRSFMKLGRAPRRPHDLTTQPRAWHWYRDAFGANKTRSWTPGGRPRLAPA